MIDFSRLEQNKFYKTMIKARKNKIIDRAMSKYSMLKNDDLEL